MNTTTVLHAEHVSFTYDGIATALRDVSLDVHAGEIMALIGPNGSGKSTFIKLVFDLLRLKEGAMSVDGHPQRHRLARQAAQHLTSNDYLPEFLRAREYLSIVSSLYGQDVNLDRAAEYFSAYGMHGRLNDLLEDFSHGMRKKTQLISAFLNRRPLTIIDETLNGVDIEALHLAEGEFNRMRSEGLSIVLCSHDFSLLERVADRLVFLDYGSVVLNASMAETVINHGSVARLVFDHLDARSPA